MRLVLEVPMVPHSLNRFMGRSPWAYRFEKHRWAQSLKVEGLVHAGRVALAWPRPPAGRVRVTIERITGRENALDQDNVVGACKPILDALRLLQLLGDDNASGLELHVLQPREPRAKRTRVTLELLGPAEDEDAPIVTALIGSHRVRWQGRRRHDA